MSTTGEEDVSLTWVLFLHPRHSNELFWRLAMAIRPHRLQTWTRYGSEISNSLSRRNWAAPWAIWQSRSISPKRRPPSLEEMKQRNKVSNRCFWWQWTQHIKDISIGVVQAFRWLVMER